MPPLIDHTPSLVPRLLLLLRARKRCTPRFICLAAPSQLLLQRLLVHFLQSFRIYERPHSPVLPILLEVSSESRNAHHRLWVAHAPSTKRVSLFGCLSAPARVVHQVKIDVRALYLIAVPAELESPVGSDLICFGAPDEAAVDAADERLVTEGGVWLFSELKG